MCIRDRCKNPELDAIVIVSPSFLHCQQIEIAMNHGKHVFCEKPLGTDAVSYTHLKQMLLDGSLDLTITQDLFRQGSQPLQMCIRDSPCTIQHRDLKEREI